jgi:hypothetical protein
MRENRVVLASSEVLVATFAERPVARAMSFGVLRVGVRRSRSVRRIYPLA